MNYRLTTNKTWAQTLNDLEDTMSKWGITKWHVENSLLPRARTKVYQSLEERTVTLHYTKDKVPVQLTMNKQTRAIDNLRALYLAVERMRMIEVSGLDDLVRQAYAQLPPPAKPMHANPYAVLGLPAHASTQDVEAAYRTKAKQVHPDTGGSEQAMRELNAARDEIRRERGIL